ncbi:protein NLP6-like isoform X2 [Gastrolobium bilobum]|uniref:protein NLP6-like isoform X2 n=1 Tax=Gastrolobium bilobum TaxID=150636 RepID=UPI002AB24EC4|nr:protein NLP6-like isoform X2 [Gastrolobium bilobum]
MTESEEGNPDFPLKSKPPEEPGCAMDFDLDLESSWCLDNLSFVSEPLSPFLFSNPSDQPSSPPLWFFSDGEDDRHARLAASAFSDCNKIFSCDSNSIAEKPVENDDNKKLLPPLVPPLENLDGYCAIKERMAQALRYFKELTEQNVLAQVWAPVRNGNRYVLTTSGQPFVLDPHSNGLHQYRTVSLTYMFSVDGENDATLGLPGRVFQHKLPEWTPNVQYYTNKEYPRRDHAQNYNVRGSLALPVFERSLQSCVGVLELIMTSQKINYAPEVDKICKALEAVNLRSSEILEHSYTQICNEGRQNALSEILEILTMVCETHNLPLAQTWVPCRHRIVLAQGGGLKKSCSSFDGSCMGQVCMSTTDIAFYIIDAHLWGFHEACVEHHLQQGQGVAGRAFLSHSMCFCRNITQFCKTDYPLVHYALMFGLTSCFAICLRSSHTGNDDYVLEFFLPPRITDFDEQKTFLGSILATMKQHFQSLKIAAGVELKEDGSIEIIEAENERVNLRLESIPIAQSIKSPPRPDVSPNIGEEVPLDLSEQQIMMYCNDIDDGRSLDDNAGGNIDQMSSLDTKNIKKPSERKRGKTEKSISLEVLQRYFAGSLKDAAKSLGVCPTTMKRICRQHGISRWPSRKINKVNRSLSKLKRVMESVQGAEGAFDLNSLRTSPLPIAVGSIPEPSTSNKFSQQASLSIGPSEPQLKENELEAYKILETNRQAGMEDQFLGGRTQSVEKVIHDKCVSTWEVEKDPKRTRTGSGSSEDSTIPTSHGSCQGSPLNESSPVKDIFITSINEQCAVLRGSPESTLQPTNALNCSTAYPMPEIVATELEEPFGGMLVEDAGSSKDLRNLCPSVAEAILEDLVPEACGTNPSASDLAPKQCMNTLDKTVTPFAARKEMKNVTIKATYREDIIRFRVSLTCGIVELKEEVAKRLKLEVGTFDIKYLDDDQEWVLIACDADLQECMDVSRSSGSNIIRVLVHDITYNLGSSCESSGG